MDRLKFDLLDTGNAFMVLNDLLLEKNLIQLAKHCKKSCNESLPYEVQKTKDWIDKFLLTLDK